MPRNNTCRSSEFAAGVNDNNNANDNDNCNGDGDQANGQQHDGIVATTATVKQEFDAAPPVCHRKSERRKIARDIFLVFEEQPSSRRRRGRGGARGKCTRAKQKFGHLSVAKTPMRSSNTNNNNSGISGSSSNNNNNNNNNNKSSVLREIKTEPKCSTAAANVSATATAAAATATATATGATATEAITGATAAVTNATATSAAATAATAMLQQLEPEKPPAKIATVKLETKTASNATTAATATVAATTAAATVAVAPQLSQSKQQLKTQQTPPPEAERCGEAAAAAGRALAATPTTPSVNPIFLWVKQDDTRIVEVRCEDYDKRNRIRLTKTTNGWRSMPRTDASSSRIVKFFHSGVAQVKREKLQHQQSMEQEEELAQKEQQHHHHHHQLEEDEQQMTHNWSVVQEDEEQHQQHQQQQQQQHLEQQQVMEEEQHHMDKQPALIESVVVVPAQQQQEQQSLDEATPDFDALLDSETNASTKATKTSTTNSSNPNTPTYQSTPSSPAPLELQLCPKTGLFLPQGVAAEMPHNNEEEEEEEEQGQQADVAAQDVELEQPKNLKDLLDDANDLLLQQCSSDNGSNNGVELLDSLVKRSCEDNLQGTTTTTTMATTTGTASGLSAFCVPDVAGKDLPSILGMDSSSMDDAPKCLSFNEAGEIEGLHGDLFLGIDAFDKQPETVTEATPATATEVEAEAESAETATRTELVDAELATEAEADAVVEKSTQPTQHVVTADETPKDLSYKKREEVCPPSESRSQCAVTSSSDILKAKSPELPELPAVASSIPAEVETTSETIKNLILEQFLKLNGGAGGGNSQQQAEPMDLGKGNARVGAGSDEKLHTVVIDDEDEEEAGDRDVEPTEPLRKRAKPIKMDKDPDALTQLKMLISNPQWKVPDPILVPKDRLGAVLASPAREIPLLLTTRPELRLPEAFAYPEIIQNPNILVVTMEQLEAILKNEAEQSKTTPTTPAQLLPLPLVQQLPSSKATASPSLKQQQHQQHKQQPPTKTLVTATPPPPPPATTAAASSSPAADSSMSTELNATTLALLQQMLWLPYFGQLSQEFFKTLKDPLGLQRKFMSNLLPLYNSQFGLQHLDELYKHCLKQKPASEAEAPPAAAAATAAVAASSPAIPTKPPAAFNGFSSPMELAFMQKLLQQQQQQQQQQQPQQSKATPQQQLHLEHKRARREHDHVAKTTPPAVTPTVAAVPSTAPSAAAVAAAPTVEHKPRLTCKSLSNLLEPESNVVPLLNVPFDALRRSAAMHNSHSKPASSQDAMMSSGRQLRSSKACVTYNPLEQQSKQSQQQQQMQRKRGNMLAHELQQQQHQQQQQQQQQQHHHQQQQHLAEAAAAAAAAGGAGLDANAALWHPLFGSNPKQGYNSPWQWTTVTATGE